VSVGHLVMGIAFLGLVGVWAVIQADAVDNDHIRWLLPVPWVLAGLGGLIALGLSSRRTRPTTQVGWVDTAADHDTTPLIDLPETPETPEENR
jgi:drug/metabolite transporter (DMT)-like permease